MIVMNFIERRAPGKTTPSYGMGVERHMGPDGNWRACVVNGPDRGPVISHELAVAADFAAVVAYIEDLEPGQ